MPNPYAAFQRLLPKTPLLVGLVTAHNADSTSTVEFPGGEKVRAAGQPVAIGLQAFVRNGEVTGEAPNLPVSVVIIP